MLQCNCTKNNHWIYLFHPKYTTGFLCEIGYCCTWMKTRNAQLRRSSCYIFTFLCLSLIHLVQVKQILLKRNKYQLTKRWLERKLEGFFGSFLRKCGSSNPNTLIVTKYQDFYHCGTVLGITSDLLYSSNSKTYGKICSSFYLASEASSHIPET